VATASSYLFRTAESAGAVPELAPVLSAGAAEPDYQDFPCSVAQERFWLLDRLEPGNPSYNVAVRWRLDGHVAPDLLESAWREIIMRHEVLRTRFLEIDSKPVQRVAAQGTFKLVVLDRGARALRSGKRPTHSRGAAAPFAAQRHYSRHDPPDRFGRLVNRCHGSRDGGDIPGAGHGCAVIARAACHSVR
jgi:hypothetical protein